MAPSPKQTIAAIAAGDGVNDIFLLAEKTIAHKRDGNPYITLVLADKTGQMRGVIWDNVEALAKAVQAGDYVHIQAGASDYRGVVQLIVKHMKPVAAETVNAAEFLPATDRDVDQMMARLQAMTDTIVNAFLKRLMAAFWEDEAFVQMFKQAPAAKSMHHAYLGGLLEHTLSMVLLADKVAGHYSGLDRDMLLVGAVLHDIGKVRELSFARQIDYTDEGRLLSHIVIGVEMVDAKLQAIGDFPPGLAAQVKHMIVSHHGIRDFGSPEVPKTIEAVLLHSIDEMDARVNGIREFMASEKSDSVWTSYHRLLERQFYKGPSDPAA